VGTIIQKAIDVNTVLGVIEITETEEQYLKDISLSNDEMHRLHSIKLPLRRLQWLSYRVLIKQLIGEYKYKGISYNKYGKPILNELPHYISVAHTGNYSAAIVSKNSSAGIDIEPIGDKILRVESKFLSSNEIACLPSTDRSKTLHIIWGVKEAIYKSYGEGELIFAEDIGVNPFIAADKGELEGFLNLKGKKTEYFRAFYEIIKGMVLVYVMPKTYSEHWNF